MRAGILAVLVCALSLAATGPAAASEFISLYGGYAWNDLQATGAGDGTVYGVRWGAENPAIGVQASLDFNRNNSVKMDSLVFSGLFNFVSRDRRLRSGQMIFNSFSSYVTLGLGATRYSQPESNASLLFTWEIGLGLQVKFNRVFGLRFEALALSITPKSARNAELTGGIAFYW